MPERRPPLSLSDERSSRRANPARAFRGAVVQAAAESRDLRRGGAARGGSLEVVTTNLTAGYLRPNGVPYSERAVVKEFFDSFTLPEDGRGSS